MLNSRFVRYLSFTTECVEEAFLSVFPSLILFLRRVTHLQSTVLYVQKRAGNYLNHE